MPKLREMNYSKRDKVWRKMFKGKPYHVTCIELGCPQTKEDSLNAANLWWKAKEAELTGATKSGSDAVKLELLNAYAGKQVESSEVPQVMNDMVQSAIRHFAPKEQSMLFLRLFGQEQYDKLFAATEQVKQAESVVDTLLAGQPMIAETVSAHVENWLAALLDKVTAGTNTLSTYKNYRTDILKFQEFAGKFLPVKSINGELIQAYYRHVGVKGKQTFKVATAFIRHLFAIEAIETLPRVLTVKGMFTFKQEEAKFDFWTMDEWKAEYEASEAGSIRRCCLLLAANCGFQACDMADLQGKFNYEEKTITKARYKTEARTVVYSLWDETAELVKKHFDELKTVWKEDTLDEAKSIKACARGLVKLRNTSINFVGNNLQLATFRFEFGGHKAKTQTDESYSKINLETARAISAFLKTCYFDTK